MVYTFTENEAEHEVMLAIDQHTYLSLVQRYKELIGKGERIGSGGGDVQLIEGYTFRDYINAYKDNAENAKFNAVVNALGVDKRLLMALMMDSVNEYNLNDFGRFDALNETVDKAKAKIYFEKQDGVTLPLFKLNIRIDQFLKQFVFAQTDDF